LAAVGGGTIWFEFTKGFGYWVLQEAIAKAKLAPAARALAPELVRSARI